MFAFPGGAWADGRVSVDAEAGAGIASNPFLTSPNEGDSVYFEFNLLPQFRIEDQLSKTTVRGSLRHRSYMSHYSGTSEGSIDFTHDRKLSNVLDATFLVGFESAVIGQRNAPGDITIVEPPTPEEGNDLGVPDVTLVGSRQRQQRIRASTSLDYDMSERDSLSGGIEFGRTHNPNLFDDTNYQSLSASVKYKRRLSERSSIGAVMNGERIWYDSNGGTYEIYRPQLVYSTRLAAGWSLDAAAGGLIIKGSGTPGDFTSWSYSASVLLCRQGERSRFCAALQRDATASALAGVRRFVNASAHYSHRLNKDLSADLNSTYSRFGGGRLQSGSSSLWTAAGGVQLDLSQRTIAHAGVGLRRVGYSQGGHSTDGYAQGSVSFTLGSLR